MANIKFYYRSKKEIASLILRFHHGKMIDHFIPTSITIPKKNWDQKKQRVKTTNDFPSGSVINENLLKLEAHLLSEFNTSFMAGEDIDSDWIRKSTLLFFNRPAYELEKKKQEDRNTYLLSFIKYFNDEVIAKGEWLNLKTKEPLAPKSAQAYKTTEGVIEKFEASRKTKTRLKDVDIKWCKDLKDWMEADGLKTNYINKNIGRIRFFCTRAEELGIEVNKEYNNRAFSAPTEDTVSTYLNEEELQKIFDYNYGDDVKYDNVRDWLIIGCYTGLRVSDLRKLKAGRDIGQDFIHVQTTKTKAKVTIPIHSKVRAILEKRNGEFPKAYSSQKFNEYVKDACRLAGITNEIFCEIAGKGNKKVAKIAPKYLAVSSHICRRSFATNHYGKLHSSVIMAIGGWKTESSFLKYLKKSSSEHALEMQKYWNNQDQVKLKKD
jgi:integrase